MAHLQALLEAKQERVRQGPGWPEAPVPHAAAPQDLHTVQSSALSPEARFSHSLAHQCGDQSKRK